MTVTGYSDRINHAFAFAAKHHDQQVRKGTRLPYLTQPANVAVILTRYGRDESTVVAGILHDTVADAVREGWTRETLDERIGRKFGMDSLETILAVTERRSDDDGVELSADDRRTDLLARLASPATPPATARTTWCSTSRALVPGDHGSVPAARERLVSRRVPCARRGGADCGGARAGDGALEQAGE
jgi:hypothetical protein